jgi:hypothetical protein
MNSCVKLLVTIALMVPLPLSGEEQRQVTLVHRVPFAGEVEQVLLVAMGDEAQPEIVEAAWIAPQHGEELSCIGRVGVPQTAERVQVMSVLVGTRGEVRSVVHEYAADELPPTSRLSLAELRARFVERRGVFRRLQNEIEGQQERMSTLQRDADAIAMVSRIVSVEDELAEVKSKLQRVTLAQQGIDRRTSQMKGRPQPLNSKKREAELVKQLGELSTALSAAENQALKKLAGANGELQNKLALIEETRGEQMFLLEEELGRLRRAQ